jgi:hypothetical protein
MRGATRSTAIPPSSRARRWRGLPELDAWYHAELPALVRARPSAHVTLPELVRVTEWKMARGVWRAPNLVLVRGNDADAVARTSAEALAAIPHPTRPIAGLATLAGVGPATASAVAAAAAPERYPFFDELVAAQVPALGAVKWTLGYYARYADAPPLARRRAGRRLDARDGRARALGRRGGRRESGRSALGESGRR